MRNYKKLEIWEISKNISLNVYKTTSSFPKTEQYGLTSQIRRAAVSVPSNIAEGCGKNTSSDLAKFIDIALGSLFELETQLLISLELKYISNDNFNSIDKNIEICRRKIINFLKSIRG